MQIGSNKYPFMCIWQHVVRSNSSLFHFQCEKMKLFSWINVRSCKLFFFSFPTFCDRRRSQNSRYISVNAIYCIWCHSIWLISAWGAHRPLCWRRRISRMSIVCAIISTWIRFIWIIAAIINCASANNQKYWRKMMRHTMSSTSVANSNQSKEPPNIAWPRIALLLMLPLKMIRVMSQFHLRIW